MQKSGFFNALLSNGAYDRKYNANDYSDNLAVVISNGVLRSVNDDLRVSASGLVVSVAAGRAWIEGHYYYNDSPYSFPAVTAPAAGSRIDRVFLRLDTAISARKIELVYRQGTAATTPTPPAPVVQGTVYELVLADVFVGTNASSVGVTDKRADPSLCGWVYSVIGDNSFFTSLDNSFNAWFAEKRDTLSSVTLFKRYSWRTVLSSASSVVTFNIPQWDSTTDFLEVYINGMLDAQGVDYTVTGNTITFKNSLVAGTEITVYSYKSVDGTGIMSVADEITALQNEVAALKGDIDSVYVCNGVNDNVELSKIAQAWLNGGTDYGNKRIRVVGNFGATAPNAGGGTSTNNYRWIDAGGNGAVNRRIILDFSSCSQIEINCPDDTYNVIFYGLQVDVVGANVIATGGAAIYMFSTAGQTVINAERSRFWITSKAGLIARSGTFRDCRTSLTTDGENAWSFNVLTGGLLRIYGGEHYTYAATGFESGVVYVNSGQANAVAITYGMNCPQVARSNYVQTYAVNCLSNNALCSFTDTITTLPITAPGQNIRGTLARSKPGLM